MQLIDKQVERSDAERILRHDLVAHLGSPG